jgi:hypothetical protein
MLLALVMRFFKYCNHGNSPSMEMHTQTDQVNNRPLNNEVFNVVGEFLFIYKSHNSIKNKVNLKLLGLLYVDSLAT